MPAPSALLASSPCPAVSLAALFPTRSNTMPSTRRSRALYQSNDYFPWHALPSELKLHVLQQLLPKFEYDPDTFGLTEDASKQMRSVTSLLCLDRETFNTLTPTAYSQRIVDFGDPVQLANELLNCCSTAYLTNLRYLIFRPGHNGHTRDLTHALNEMLRMLSVFKELRKTLHCFTIRHFYSYDDYQMSSVNAAWAHRRWVLSEKWIGGGCEIFQRRFRPKAFKVEKRFEVMPISDDPASGTAEVVSLIYRRDSVSLCTMPQLLTQSADGQTTEGSRMFRI